jgi:hypothetical protein
MWTGIILTSNTFYIHRFTNAALDKLFGTKWVARVKVSTANDETRHEKYILLNWDSSPDLPEYPVVV